MLRAVHFALMLTPPDRQRRAPRKPMSPLGVLGKFLFAMLLAALIATGKQVVTTAPQNENKTARTPTAHQPSLMVSETRFGLSHPLPRGNGTIRLATYNTLNLFDHADDPSLQGEFDDITMATSHDRCLRLAEAIRAIDADIIALEEIESLEALKWFRDTYLNDAGYKHLASLDVGYYRGVECSVMSRFEITSAKVWLNESLDGIPRVGPGWAPLPPNTHLTFQRSPLLVTIKIDGGYELTIFAVHHKAGAQFDYHLDAEAARVVQLIDELRRSDPSRNVVVMGDFNASPSDKSLRLYLEAGMIDTLAHRVWQGDDAETRLYKTHESNRVLDYILLNSAAHRELVVGSQFVYGTVAPPPTYDFHHDPYPPGHAAHDYPVAIDLMPKDHLRAR